MAPGDDYAPWLQQDTGYAGFLPDEVPIMGSARKNGGGDAPQALPGPRQATRSRARPKPAPVKVRVRVDDMDGRLGVNVTILDQVAARFAAAGIDLDIAYGKFTERELAFNGVIPVIIVSDPLTTAQTDRWTAIQDAMNLEQDVQPTLLADELSATGTDATTRQIIASTRTWMSGTVMGNPLHAPVAISVGRLDAIIGQKVPQQFASQVFIDEISNTITHECGHAFGLVLSLKSGPDKHPSNARDVMSRDNFDSMGGIANLPIADADWQALLSAYKLPEFSAADANILKKAQKDFQNKVNAKRNIEWKFSASNQVKDRKPNPAHL